MHSVDALSAGSHGGSLRRLISKFYIHPPNQAGDLTRPGPKARRILIGAQPIHTLRYQHFTVELQLEPGAFSMGKRAGLALPNPRKWEALVAEFAPYIGEVYGSGNTSLGVFI